MFEFIGVVAVLALVGAFLYYRKHKAAVLAAAAVLKAADKVGPSPVVPVTTPAPAAPANDTTQA
jgi:hypothetical protein